MSIRLYELLVCLAISALGGCLVIPMPTGEEAPYINVETDLLVGQTKKDQVRKKLGKPAAVYSHGSTYIYTAIQKNWEIAWAIIAPGPGGVGAGVEMEGEQHFLILDFDEQGILTKLQLDITDDKPGSCSDMGICHDGAGHVVQRSSEAEEAKAKEFSIPSKQCGTYLYFDTRRYFSNRNTELTTVELDGDHMGYAGQWGVGTFFYWLLDPGKHEMGYFPEPGTLTFDCREGELIFILLTLKDGVPLSLEVVTNQEGRKQIGARGFYYPKRKLITPESGN